MATENELFHLVMDMRKGDTYARQDAQESFNDIPPTARIPELLGLVCHEECIKDEERVLLAKQLSQDVAFHFLAFFQPVSEEEKIRFLDGFFLCLEKWAGNSDVAEELCCAISSVARKVRGASGMAKLEEQIMSRVLAYLAQDANLLHVAGWTILGLTPQLKGVKKNMDTLLSHFATDMDSACQLVRFEAAHNLMGFAMHFHDDAQVLTRLKGLIPLLMRSVEGSIASGEEKFVRRLSSCIELCPAGYFEACHDELMKMALDALRSSVERSVEGNTTVQLLLDLIGRILELASNPNRDIDGDWMEYSDAIPVLYSLIDMIAVGLKKGNAGQSDESSPCFDWKFVKSVERVTSWICIMYEFCFEESICIDFCRSSRASREDAVFHALAIAIVSVPGMIRNFPLAFGFISKCLRSRDQRIRHATGYLLQSLMVKNGGLSKSSDSDSEDEGRFNNDNERVLDLLAKEKDPYLRLTFYVTAPRMLHDTVKRIMWQGDEAENAVRHTFERLVSCLEVEMAYFHETGSTRILEQLLTALRDSWIVCQRLMCEGYCNHRQRVLPLLRTIATWFRGDNHIKKFLKFLPAAWKMCDLVKSKGDFKALSLSAIMCYWTGLPNGSVVEDLPWIATVLKELLPVDRQHGLSDSELEVVERLIQTWTWALDRQQLGTNCGIIPSDVLSIGLASMIQLAAASVFTDEFMDRLEVPAAAKPPFNYNWSSCDDVDKVSGRSVLFYAGNRQLIRVGKRALDAKILAIERITKIVSEWPEAVKPHLGDIAQLMGCLMLYNFNQPIGVQLYQLEGETDFKPVVLREKAANCIAAVLQVASQIGGHELVVELWTIVEPIFVGVVLDPGRIPSPSLLHDFRKVLKALPEEYAVGMLPTTEAIISTTVKSYMSEFGYTDYLDEKDDDLIYQRRSLPSLLLDEITGLLKDGLLALCKSPDEQSIFDDLPDLCEQLIVTAGEENVCCLKVGLGLVRGLLAVERYSVKNRLKWLLGRLAITFGDIFHPMSKRRFTFDRRYIYLCNRFLLAKDAVEFFGTLVPLYLDEPEVVDDAIAMCLRTLREQQLPEDVFSGTTAIGFTILATLHLLNAAGHRISPSRISECMDAIMLRTLSIFPDDDYVSRHKYSPVRHMGIKEVLSQLLMSDNAALQAHKQRLKDIDAKLAALLFYNY